MSSDEDDYMSEKFLSGITGTGTDDIRPGLMHSHKMKRKHEIERKKQILDDAHRKRMRPIQEIQEEKLKEGLQTPLDSSNKGFALMQKMGYKSGMCLGRQGTGIIEPVGVVVKSDRIGLGWQQLLAEKRKKMEERLKSQRKEFDPAEYRAHMSNQHNKKLIEADLRKSRKACYELDFKEGIVNPPEFWFWPKHTWEAEEGDEEEEEKADEDEAEVPVPNSSSKNNSEEDSTWLSPDISEILEPSDQLQILTSYLRSTYLYCVWCFTEYDDLEDLGNHCPGPTRSDHND